MGPLSAVTSGARSLFVQALHAVGLNGVDVGTGTFKPLEFDRYAQSKKLLQAMCEGNWWREHPYRYPYGLVPHRPIVSNVAGKHLDMVMTLLHNPFHGHPARISHPKVPIEGGRSVLGFPALTGYWFRRPFVRALTEAGHHYAPFPFPPELLEGNPFIDWDELTVHATHIAAQNPLLLFRPRLTGIGGSHGGMVVGRWSEVAGGVPAEDVAKKLLTYQRMSETGRAHFIKDLERVGRLLREAGFQGFAVASPQQGLSFQESRGKGRYAPLVSATNALNPHLLDAYDGDHLAQFKAKHHQAGQVVATATDKRPLLDPIDAAVVAAMSFLNLLSDSSDLPSDRFIPTASQAVRRPDGTRIPTVEFGGHHVAALTYYRAGQALAEVMAQVPLTVYPS